VATIGSLIVKIGTNTKDLEKGLKRGVDQVEKAGKKMEGLADTADEVSEGLDGVGQSGRKGLGGIEIGIDNARGAFLGFLGAITAGLGVLAVLDFLKNAIMAVGKAILDTAKDYGQAMRDIEARTGATGRDLEALGDTAVDIWKNNWGDSISDAADAVIQTNQVLGETGDVLENSATKALIMRDVFGVEIPESLRAVRSAVESFGIESDQVFDMMAKTIQNVGDPAGDLADTVNEYSTVFAQAGFSAEEMFGILEAGVGAGARNFDVVADAVKEFVIRIIDGSDLTRDALTDLFDAVGQGSLEFETLTSELGQVEAALAANETALKSSEGAYKAQRAVVGELQRQLDEARRELDKLSRPNLAGMEEFDDTLFDLEQRAKRAELALLDLVPETDAYEETEKVLDEINKQLDKVSLERDLIFDEQLRNIEKAATQGLEPVVSYGQALDAIAQKRNEIAGIESALATETGILAPLETDFNNLTQENEQLKTSMAGLKSQLEGIKTPAGEMLAGLADGSITGRDAMSQVIRMLQQVDDKVLQNEIGVALFGTKWEDLGAQVILSLDPAVAKLHDFEGAADAAGEAAGGGMENALEALKRGLLGSIVQSEDFQELMTRGSEVVIKFAGDLQGTLGDAMILIDDALNRIATSLGHTGDEFTGVDFLILVFEKSLGLITTTVQAFAIGMELLSGWVFLASEAITGIGGAIEGVLGWFDKLGDKLDGLKVPDFLQMHSPPPLYTALQFIKRGLSDLPSLDQAFGFNGMQALPAVAGAGAASSGGGSSITVNVDGVSATSVSNGDPVEDVIALVVQMLRQRLRDKKK